MIFFKLCGKHKSRNESMVNAQTYTHSTTRSSLFPSLKNNSHNMNTNFNSKSIKMTYDLFLQALNLIAIKLHPDVPVKKAILLFKSQDLELEQSLKKPERGVTQLEELINYINSSDVKSVLFNFQSSLHSLFLCYADSNSLIDFQLFFAFYKDFSIFPDIANLIEIKKMFFILLQIQTEGLKPQNTINNCIKTSVLAKYKSSKYDTLMKFDYFLYSIAIASRFVKGRDHTNEYEKLLYLFSKMIISKGMINNPRQLMKSNSLNNVNKDMIEMISLVKEKYPNYFPQTDKINIMLNSNNAYDKLFEESND